MQLRELVAALLLLVGCSKPEKAADAKGSAAPTVHVAPVPQLDEELKAPIPAMPLLTGVFVCRSKTPSAVVWRARRPDQPWELPFELTECPTVPSIYGTATFGMDVPTAQAAVTGAMIDDNFAYLTIGDHPFQQRFNFQFDPATRTLQIFSFQVDADGFAAMKAAWGEPLVRTRYGKKLYAWFNSATRTKAHAIEESWYRTSAQTATFEKIPAYRVSFVEYTPLVALLGPGGIVGKPLLGRSAQEIAAAHPGLFVAADRNQLERDESVPTKPPRTMRVPETETGEQQTLIFGTWAGGKLEGYSFTIPYGKDDRLRQELLAQVVAALGNPIEARKGEYTFKTPNGLFVDLERGYTGEEWQLKVRAK